MGMIRLTAAIGALLLLAGCGQPGPSAAKGPEDPQGRRVLVVVNSTSADSMEIGRYYMDKRHIPKGNLVILSTSTDEEIPDITFKTEILDPIRAKLSLHQEPIDFIVLTKGVPIKITSQPVWGVDAMVAGMDLPNKTIDHIPPSDDQIAGSRNPYFDAHEPFSSAKYHMYLVTRLDGYNAEDAKRLVDLSLEAKPDKGPFFLDSQPLRRSYGGMEEALSEADVKLGLKGLDVKFDRTEKFVAPPYPLMGYASWGSNDQRYDANAYHHLKFKPGALAETFVSTSARTFYPRKDGQSLIADLIAQGVTGVVGYASEPYTFALARPAILFDRYTSGYNLAESFYMAAPMVKWKDVVVGDPLCSPYRRSGS